VSIESMYGHIFMYLPKSIINYNLKNKIKDNCTTAKVKYKAFRPHTPLGIDTPPSTNTNSYTRMPTRQQYVVAHHNIFIYPNSGAKN
jgi:hypothetical protein